MILVVKRPASPAPALIHDWLCAAERGDLSTLKRLFAADSRLVDASGRGPYWTGNFRALHYAAYRGHRSVLTWLLDRGASAAPVAGDADWAPLHFAALPAKPGIVRLLVGRGAPIDVFVAAALGDVRKVRQMVRTDPTLVVRRGPDGATALHFSGSVAVARALLEAGARPDARDRFHKQTAAEWTLDKPTVARVLAKAGSSRGPALACAVGDLPSVRRFVCGNPGSRRARLSASYALGSHRETLLSVAARHGRRRIVEFLLEQGATLRPSPLPAAVQTGDLQIVKRLLQAGANPNAFCPEGFTALHAATIDGRLTMIRLLLSSGARLDLRDADHNATPLDWARHFGKKAAVALLSQMSRKRPRSSGRGRTH